MKAFTFRHTALTFALALAHAQGAWAGTTTVALTGTAAPGTGDGVSFRSLLSPPQLNAAGQVAFSGLLIGAGVSADNNSGLWRDTVLIAREGSAAPGTSSGVNFNFVSSPQLNAAGQVAFLGGLSGTGVTTSNDAGIWLDSRLIARTGSAAPGAGSGGSFLSFVNGGQVNAAGQVAFRAQLTGTGVNAGNDSGIWRGDSLIARTGNAAPGTASGVSFSALSLAGINELGQVAYQGQLTGTGVNSGNEIGIWRDSRLIARQGDAAPGTAAGVSFGIPAPPLLNAAGQAAFEANLTGTGITQSNNRGIWRDSSLIAREGDAAPGTAIGVSFASVSLGGINAAGQVLYSGFLTGTGITLANSSGIWRDATLIVRTGQAAPGTGSGITINGVQSAQLNAGGVVAFGATLAGAGVFSNNNGAFYLSDGTESVQVARTGDALAGSTITSVAATTAGSSFNDKAQLAYTATLADGRSGIFLFTPTLHWRSGTGGSWEDAAKWTLGVNPTDVHDVALDAASSLRITGPSGNVTLKSLQVGTGAGLVTLQMAGGSIGAAEPIEIGARGLLTGTGSFSRLVINRGTVQAEHLVMSESLVNHGLVRGVAGGPRQGAGLEANLLNQTGRVLVQPGETLQLRGADHRNLGVFEINQGRLEVTGTLLNGSGGVIDLNKATALADGAWTNAAGARILLGDARLTVSRGLTNAGQVLVTSGDSDVFGAVTNQRAGQVILSGQGTTTFYDAVELQAGSELRTSAGATAVFFGAVAQRTGALLTGTGHKYFEGGFSVGNSPGLGEDAGNVAFGLGNVYLAEIGGTTLGSGYDHYRVAGTLTLGGTLQLTSFDGFTGQAGQSFDLFDWGTLQGQFSSIDSSGLQLAAGTALDLSRLYTDGVIGVSAVPEPGSWALMAAGLLGLGGWSRRRSAARHAA